jgi:hypothetical protein
MSFVIPFKSIFAKLDQDYAPLCMFVIIDDSGKLEPKEK